jgi:hypothetical protein
MFPLEEPEEIDVVWATEAACTVEAAEAVPKEVDPEL